MATLKAAQHAARVGEKLAKRRGGSDYTVTVVKRGTGWGIATDDMMKVRAPYVQGIELETRDEAYRRMGRRSRASRRFWRRGRKMVDLVYRRRPRRGRRPTPEMISRRVRGAIIGSGLSLGNKTRRERARFIRRKRRTQEA